MMIIVDKTGDVFTITSDSDDDVTYETTLLGCTCPAKAKWQPSENCKHMRWLAAYWYGKDLAKDSVESIMGGITDFDCSGCDAPIGARDEVHICWRCGAVWHQACDHSRHRC